uniref:Uncharacterized protein n=1 Tax=Anopheles atroparvus TaxID=41427 RepID=A0A182JEY8_ANOAO
MKRERKDESKPRRSVLFGSHFSPNLPPHGASASSPPGRTTEPPHLTPPITAALPATDSTEPDSTRQYFSSVHWLLLAAFYRFLFDDHAPTSSLLLLLLCVLFLNHYRAVIVMVVFHDLIVPKDAVDTIGDQLTGASFVERHADVGTGEQ